MVSQLFIVQVFFLWPTVTALRQSLYMQDAFCPKETFDSLAKFTRVLASRS